MYYIKKYADCWAIHNDGNGKSRKLTDREAELAMGEFPELKDPKTATVYSDTVKSAQGQAIAFPEASPGQAFLSTENIFS